MLGSQIPTFNNEEEKPKKSKKKNKERKTKSKKRKEKIIKGEMCFSIDET